ncbi:cyclin-dependent kinase F-4-like [Wolffia australiana]
MDSYRVVKEVGDGTFGCVWRAVNKFTGEVVAIKKMKKKYYSWEECMNLREVKSLRMMEHPNIVKLKEVIREHDILYLVFEFMEFDLYQVMKDQTQLFSESKIRSWCFQVFHALAYMHQRGCFHRDLKPENLLITKDTIKVADFGLAREVCSKPPYTEYVSTRWYRAPEVLLQSPVYGPEVDMWAMGAIMAELFTLRPLFPGSSEADEIYKICTVIGSPNHNSWAEGLRLAGEMKYQFPQFSGVALSEIIPSASDDAISLITRLCSWDPRKRPSAVEALQHPFFQPCLCYIPPSLRWRAAGSSPPYSPQRVMKEEDAGQRRNSGRNYSFGALNPPPRMNPSMLNASAHAGGQRKPEINPQVLQPRYLPPQRNYQQVAGMHQQQGGRRASWRASDVAAKLGQMTLGPVARPAPTTWRQPPPPLMKAGGWHRQADLIGCPAATAATQSAPRKVAG